MKDSDIYELHEICVTGKISREECLTALLALREVVDEEEAHIQADHLLLRLIDDYEIASAFVALHRYYA